MTTARPATTASPQNGPLGNLSQPQARERTPWLLAFLCLLIPILPSYSVPPGPLKSNGSPAKLIAIIAFGLAVLGFVLIRRTASTCTVRPGVVLILVYFLMVLAVYGVGLSHRDSALVEASKTRALIGRGRECRCGALCHDASRNRTAALYPSRVPRDRAYVQLCGRFVAEFRAHRPAFAISAAGFRNQPPQIKGAASAGVLSERFGAKRAFGTSGHAIEFSVLAAVTVPLTIHFARYAANRRVRVLAALACGLALLAMPAGSFEKWCYCARRSLPGLYVVLQTARTQRCRGGRRHRASRRNPRCSGHRSSALANDHPIRRRTKASWNGSRTIPRCHRPSTIIRCLASALAGHYRSSTASSTMNGCRRLYRAVPSALVAMIVLASGGIFGLAAALRGATSPRERDQAYAMGAMLIGILASSYTFDLFSFQQATLVFFILFGLLWSNFTICYPEVRHASGGRSSIFRRSR